ncbi:MAG: 2,3-bisphosphoglycerate-independent phosphoglycerate mutase [candidate division WS2 bacterium ADurb.Bin280]|uniref:2,3-bisphosphoglycerate-independent phosphoglycerate mutase n=1 Tax=candidate division WS2 bacterium ADurb.Bin280 TaxID=1852829 RepID=A0A1V5SBR9_9BACT|nr:MAG: 2,3-bisphosphoglycerate-independent phosphoglycerate mutase [candidate division WS2 bacterium ADurb.Bin280]
MGIISDGGIHSHIVHLFALMKLCKMIGHDDVQLHCFTDGRDTPSMQGVEFLNKIKFASESLQIGKVATIIGRSFLDRNGNWQKTQSCYKALVEDIGEKMSDPLAAISSSYKKGETDEFIKPIIIEGSKRIKDNDTVIFYNFRSDRTRQLVSAFLDPNFDKFKRKKLQNLDFITFIPYGIEKELGVQAKSAFPAISIDNTIGKFYENLGAKQFHIAETEKFAHVTYFINGNKEDPYNGEERVLIPSPDVHSYAEKPQMSIQEVTDNLIRRMKSSDFSLHICNFANGDMVGHTGDFQAALYAVESIDSALRQVVDVALDQNIPTIITADHGNIELMLDPITGEPHNEHTSNPVPAIFVSNEKYRLKTNAKISNLVSTCLQLSGIEKPQYFSDGIIEDIVK